MPSALVPLINGFEEIEAIAVIDILRRADIDVVVAGVESATITGSHSVRVIAERVIAEVREREFDAVVLPGGPGTANLGANSFVTEIVKRHARQGKWIAAICAAPSILARLGLLAGKKAACHTSVEAKMKGAKVVFDPVAVDGKYITSRGAGTAVVFALAIVEKLVSKAKADDLAARMCVPGAPAAR